MNVRYVGILSPRPCWPSSGVSGSSPSARPRRAPVLGLGGDGAAPDGAAGSPRPVPRWRGRPGRDGSSWSAGSPRTESPVPRSTCTTGSPTSGRRARPSRWDSTMSGWPRSANGCTWPAATTTRWPAREWQAQSRVLSLGPRDQAWREEPPLAGARGGLALAAVGDRLVAIGGPAPAPAPRDPAPHRGVPAGPAGGGWQPGPDLTVPRDHLAAGSPAAGSLPSPAARVRSRATWRRWSRGTRRPTRVGGRSRP